MGIDNKPSQFSGANGSLFERLTVASMLRHPFTVTESKPGCYQTEVRHLPDKKIRNIQYRYVLVAAPQGADQSAPGLYMETNIPAAIWGARLDLAYGIREAAHLDFDLARPDSAGRRALEFQSMETPDSFIVLQLQG